jgi:hypothetical protein
MHVNRGAADKLDAGARQQGHALQRHRSSTVSRGPLVVVLGIGQVQITESRRGNPHPQRAFSFPADRNVASHDIEALQPGRYQGGAIGVVEEAVMEGEVQQEKSSRA